MSSLPAPYDRKHIFALESSNTPSFPIQGFNLDAEFNAIEQAMDQTQARLGQIQRDDGELANDSVGPDQLQDDIWEEGEQAAADAAQEVIDAGIVEIEAIKDLAEAAAVAAEMCRDQACACAAAAEDSADNAEDAAEEAQEDAADAANSADLARFYYEQIDNAYDAVAPRTIQFVTAGSTPSYNLPVPVTDEEFLDVHVDGLLLPPTAYSVSGATVTFTPAIATGKTVVIKIASGLQLMPLSIEDWGWITDAVASGDDWGAVA